MGKCKLEMTENEALVLFDWIVRFNEDRKCGFEDSSEERVLFDLESLLEKELSSILSKNYKDLLLGARQKVRGE